MRIRVRGLPPQQSADTLIHYESAMEATRRTVETLENDPLCVFLDVGGEGDDPSVLTVLRGPTVLEQVEYKQKDTTELAYRVAGKLATHLASLSADVQYAVGVDTIGLGRGVYDQLMNLHRIRNVYKLDVSELPMDPTRFHRMRDQVWWELREGCMDTRELALTLPGAPQLVQDTVVSEITSIKWAEVNGKIKVQGKGSSSGIPGVRPLAKSPNYGDALCGAWYLYKHCTSRLPALHRRVRNSRRAKVPSWKAL